MSPISADIARIEAVLADAVEALAERRPVDLAELNGMVEELCDKVRAEPEKATPETIEAMGRLIESLDRLAQDITARRDELAGRPPGGRG